MVHRIALTKARINLGQIVRRVHINKERFVLEKDGIPVAGLIGVDELEDWLEVNDPEIQRQIEEGYREYRAGKARPAREFLAELRREAVVPKKQNSR